MSYIVANQVAKEFGDGDSKVTAVRGINLAIEQGKFISIMGESGAGKSTLLSMLGGLLSPSSGEILIGGINIYDLHTEKRADFRREFMGFIFQSFQLIPVPERVGERSASPRGDASLGVEQAKPRTSGAGKSGSERQGSPTSQSALRR